MSVLKRLEGIVRHGQRFELRCTCGAATWDTTADHGNAQLIPLVCCVCGIKFIGLEELVREDEAGQ